MFLPYEKGRMTEDDYANIIRSMIGDMDAEKVINQKRAEALSLMKFLNDMKENPEKMYSETVKGLGDMVFTMAQRHKKPIDEVLAAIKGEAENVEASLKRIWEE